MSQPIESYALIGDMQTAALVSRTGSIDWACFPRFDSGACFAALLGDEDEGLWRIAPAGSKLEATCNSRAYRDDSMILETVWETKRGSVRVIDFMPPRGDAPDIVRIVEGVSGSVEIESLLRIRYDYGSITPWVRRSDGALSAVAGPDAMWLRSPVQHTGEDFAHRARFRVDAGDRVPFVLTWNPSHEPAPRQVDAERALSDTVKHWADWIAHCNYDGEWREAVVRSLLTLKTLTYRPTGGVVAAVTTSLPEALGGSRNWDYRYCWLRDATMTLQALVSTGHEDEAVSWRNWLLRAIGGSPQNLQIMYGLGGERRLQEFTLDDLPGYEGSTPVRIGNAASGQKQLDVYGEVLDALHLDRCSGLDGDGYAWSVQRSLLDVLADTWDKPDQGLWEVRGEPQHFVHSKVMAWVGFDRAIQAVEDYGKDGPVNRWRKLRDEIKADVMKHGFDSDRNTFTQAYGSKDLDAACLLIPQVGFLPPDDPHVVGTIEAIQHELSDGGLLYRYSADTGSGGGDGLDGQEGTFIACTLWLADDLDLMGRSDEGREVLEHVLDLRNDVGLLSEEYDVRTCRQVGNTPQAFSHVPVINTARALTRTGEHRGRIGRAGPRPTTGGS
jgi:GH15 family glucan-1,4-alpha-glucosidase